MYAYPVKLSKLSPHCCPKPSSHAITPYIHVRAIMHPQHAIQAPLIPIHVRYDEVQNYHLINYTNIYMHNVKLQRLFQSRITNFCWSFYVNIIYNIDLFMFIVFITLATANLNHRKILHYKWLKCRFDQWTINCWITSTKISVCFNFGFFERDT